MGAIARRSLGRRSTLVGLLAATFASAPVPSAAVPAAKVGTRGSATQPARTAEAAPESPYEVLEQLARVLHLVEQDYVTEVDRARLIEGGIKGMVEALDPHSAYLPATDYSIFRSDTEGEFGGIGVEVDFSARAVTIVRPMEGSPAERAGLLPGDRILTIAGQPVASRSPAELVKAMRGAPGSRVQIRVERPARSALGARSFEAPRVFDLVLTREVIRVRSVFAKRLDGDVAYFRIKQFQSGTHSELLAAVARLRREVPRPFAGVLLDLRSNPGGLVHEAVAVADEFLSGGVIYSTRHRGRVLDEVRATSGGALRRGPLCVLVNEQSASAAELVAGALQDHDRGAIVGAKTFGKGSVQTILDLPNGAGLKLTTMLYFTPSGRAIQADGVKPDVVVEASALRATTPALREADLPDHLDAAPPSSVDPDAPRGPEAVARKPQNAARDDVPLDPTGKPDHALSIAYQIVTGVLGRVQTK